MKGGDQCRGQTQQLPLVAPSGFEPDSNDYKSFASSQLSYGAVYFSHSVSRACPRTLDVLFPSG